jgi:polysaccharide export outer membrane protein
MYNIVAALLLMALAVISNAAQTQKVPPKELIQYIRDARQRGVNEARIKREAVAVGWDASAVDEAIASVKTNRAPEAPASRKESSGQPNVNQPAAPVAGQNQEAGPVAPPAGRDIPDDYQIGAGDTLQISVWKEPDVSVPSVVVRPDGMITVPLIKEVPVLGLTPRQVEKTIADGLSKYITDANVTVVVAAINSKKIYIIGAVRREGPLPYTYRMTVMQALSEAGGLTEYAKRKNIYIIRTENGKEYRLDFNYEDVIRGIRMEQNIPLAAGDTLIIPQ